MTRAEEMALHCIALFIRIQDAAGGELRVTHGAVSEVLECGLIPTEIVAYCEWIDQTGIRRREHI